MLNLDNQQATSWISGIIEGEATFKTKGSTYKAIDIPNNDLDIINSCEKYLRDNHIFFNTYVVKAGKKFGYRLVISQQDCVILSNKLLATIECRKNELQKMLGASETESDLSIDLLWTIGIIEAEGAIFLSQNYRGHLTPRIELDNTNDKIIFKLVKNLHNLGCSYYVKDYTPEARKPYTKITIQGVKRCHRFFNKTLNLWQSSKILKKTSLLLEYCDNRLNKPVNSHYENGDYNFYNKLRQLNA